MTIAARAMLLKTYFGCILIHSLPYPEKSTARVQARDFASQVSLVDGPVDGRDVWKFTAVIDADFRLDHRLELAVHLHDQFRISGNDGARSRTSHPETGVAPLLLIACAIRREPGTGAKRDGRTATRACRRIAQQRRDSGVRKIAYAARRHPRAGAGCA